MSDEETRALLGIGVVLPNLPILLASGGAVALALVERPRRRGASRLWLIAGLALVGAVTLGSLGHVWLALPSVQEQYQLSFAKIGLISFILSFVAGLLSAAAVALLLLMSMRPPEVTPVSRSEFWRHLRRLYWTAFGIGIGLSGLHLGARLSGWLALIAVAFAASAALGPLFPVSFLAAARSVLSLGWGRLLLLVAALLVPVLNLVVVVMLDRRIGLRIRESGAGGDV
jgi:hypothetical protein